MACVSPSLHRFRNMLRSPWITGRLHGPRMHTMVIASIFKTTQGTTIVGCVLLCRLHSVHNSPQGFPGLIKLWDDQPTRISTGRTYGQSAPYWGVLVVAYNPMFTCTRSNTVCNYSMIGAKISHTVWIIISDLTWVQWIIGWYVTKYYSSAWFDYSKEIVGKLSKLHFIFYFL